MSKIPETIGRFNPPTPARPFEPFVPPQLIDLVGIPQRARPRNIWLLDEEAAR